MKGCRNLTDEEITDVFGVLKCLRDKSLFLLGVKTGLRISELLSLKVKDVYEHGEIGDYVTVSKSNTKGKIESKTVPLSVSVKEGLKNYLLLRPLNPEDPLFKSTKSNRPITRMQAHRVLKTAFKQLKMTGRLSTHAMRKSFAHRVHKALGEKIERTQVALGHKSLSSTASYLQVDREEVEKAILSQG